MSTRQLLLLVRSTEFALVVALAATLLGGVLAASGLRRPAVRRWWLPMGLLMPPYLHGLAHQAWWTALGWSPPSLMAAWLAQSLALTPLAAAVLGMAWDQIDGDQIDVLRCCSSPAGVRSGAAALMRPGLMAAAGLASLLTLNDYTVPSLFGVDLYAMELFARFSADGDAGRTTLLALPLALLALLTAWPAVGLARRWAAPGSGARRQPRRLANGWLGAAGDLVLAACVGLPLGLLILSAGSPRTWPAAAAAVAPDLLGTLKVAGLGGLMACALGAALVPGLRRGAWWLLAPALVPGALVGVAVIGLLGSPMGDQLARTSAPPALACALRFAPLAALVLLAHGASLDRGLCDAARVHGGSRWSVWWRGFWPLWWPGLALAFLVPAALTCNELPATVLTLAPGHGTVTVRIYNLLHYGASQQAAAEALVAALLILALVAVTGRRNPP